MCTLDYCVEKARRERQNPLFISHKYYLWKCISTGKNIWNEYICVNVAWLQRDIYLQPFGFIHTTQTFADFEMENKLFRWIPRSLQTENENLVYPIIPNEKKIFFWNKKLVKAIYLCYTHQWKSQKIQQYKSTINHQIKTHTKNFTWKI